jgi:hypothetical protein
MPQLQLAMKATNWSFKDPQSSCCPQYRAIETKRQKTGCFVTNRRVTDGKKKESE